MCQDEQTLLDTGLRLVVVGPDTKQAFADYATRSGLPGLAVADPDHTILKLYGQDVRLLKFGRMPAAVLVGDTGRVAWVHYGADMKDAPSASDILAHL